METLREFSHYSVVSEKIDDCPCKYDDSINLMTILVGIFAAMFFVISAQYGNLIFVIAFFIIGAIGFFGGLYIHGSTSGCGSKIKLRDDDINDSPIMTRSLQFTDNPDYDALEITKIMDDFEKYINEFNVENKKCEEEKLKSQKECCNKYKSVIQKVK